MIDHGANLEEVDPEGNTPLLLAIKECQSNTISTLLERGANIDTCDKQGLTPLLVAANTGNLALVEQLLESGASLKHHNKDGHCPLHIAAKLGMNEVCAFFIILLEGHQTYSVYLATI